MSKQIEDAATVYRKEYLKDEYAGCRAAYSAGWREAVRSDVRVLALVEALDEIAKPWSDKNDLANYYESKARIALAKWREGGKNDTK